jgi:bifunctional non-homologous end joining protein LigD
MLVSETPRPFDQPGWTHELKYDGYRILAEIDDEGVRLQTRNGTDATQWFPELYAPLRTLGKGRTVLDGEVCVLDDRGRSSFDRLQDRAKRRGFRESDDPVVYCIFDVLVHRGLDVRALPLANRKAILTRLLRVSRPSLLLVRDIPGRGAWLYEQACALGLEGIVSKRLDSPYSSAERTGAWVKIARPGAVPPERLKRSE